MVYIDDILHCDDDVLEKEVDGKLCERFLAGSQQ